MERIPILIGRKPDPGLPEYRQMMNYEDGTATQHAANIAGSHTEPWLNALEYFEPAAPPAVRRTLEDPILCSAVRGRVLDVAAGTCWATAMISRLDRVNEVVALDLSENFLLTVGDRIINHFSGDRRKIRFAVSTFNAIPFEDAYFDCAYLVATLHHAQAPLVTLSEIIRVLKPDGTLFVISSSSPVLGLARARERSLAASRQAGFTDIAYSRSEIVYLLRHSGFEGVRAHALDDLVVRRSRRWVRHILRRFDLEHVLLPVSYIFEGRKAA